MVGNIKHPGKQTGTGVKHRAFLASLRALIVTVSTVVLSGCVAPLTLGVMVSDYNQAVMEATSRQLLVNIANARHHKPLQFSEVSNIAATLNFQYNAGVTPALTGESGGLLVPIFGGSYSENPTISITPVLGEDFTKRLLTPISEDKLEFILRQGGNINRVLRLMAGEFREVRNGKENIYSNRPSDRSGYPIFRRILLQLASIQHRGFLHVDPLIIQQQWTLPTNTMNSDGFFKAVHDDYLVKYDPKTQLFRMSKDVKGPVLITNYNPALLPNNERIRLHEEASNNLENEIMVDIRENFPGGEYPIRGKLRLRSLYVILVIIGQTIADEPEYPVDKDPRTPEAGENPVSALAIQEFEHYPFGVDLSIKANGYYYAVSPQSGSNWNHDAFRLLDLLYEMTVTELPHRGPSITIAK
ncbi:MAG: hypothetical protein WCP96_14360 [Methylococcaceae bacterium]